MNNQVSLNIQRSKLRINNQSILINELLDYLDNTKTYKGFSIKKNYIVKNNIIITKLLYYNNETKYNYLDIDVRSLCSIIAHDLRDIIGKNIFFDLNNGEFIFYI